jgi:hypothetical protein
MNPQKGGKAEEYAGGFRFFIGVISEISDE